MNFIASNLPDKIALSDAHQALSFAELAAATQKMAVQLQKLPAGILVLAARANPLFVIQLLAAFTIGKPVALLSPQESEQHKRAILSTNMSINDAGELLDLQENNNQHHRQLALILFTSGSTGQTKAVQLSLTNIIANCHAVIKALAFAQRNDQLLFLPLSYSFGLLGQLLPGLMSGVTTELISQFTDIKNRLETGMVPQMWSGVPSHWVAIAKMATLYPDSAAKIKALISAGAPLALPLREHLIRSFPAARIYNNYGLTEASPRVLTYSSADPLFLEDYAGYPVGDWQIRLSAQQELLIHGSQLMLGYLGEESAPKISKGWFSTGDQAEILPSGLVRIKGRLDYIVNIGGEKVNLIEIEQQICQFAGIKETIVLPLSDELYGVRLLVCLERHAVAPPTSEQLLGEQLKHHLLPKKLPLSVQFLEQLPRNQHGKLDRKALLLTSHKE